MFVCVCALLCCAPAVLLLYFQGFVRFLLTRHTIFEPQAPQKGGPVFSTGAFAEQKNAARGATRRAPAAAAAAAASKLILERTQRA